MMEIIPAILTDDPVELDRLLLLVKNIGATRVHIDILDNTLVAGRTISGWEQLENKNIWLDIDVHFMTSHPIGDASKWAGVQNVSRMIAHIESDDPFSEFMDWYQSRNRLFKIRPIHCTSKWSLVPYCVSWRTGKSIFTRCMQ